MPRRDVRAFLEDITVACERVVSFLDGTSREAFVNNLVLRAAVERQFEIIGEAMNHVRRIDPGIELEISSVSQIIDFRNLLIHGYFSVDPLQVWDIARADVQRLREEASAALRRRVSPPS